MEFRFCPVIAWLVLLCFSFLWSSRFVVWCYSLAPGAKMELCMPIEIYSVVGKAVYLIHQRSIWRKGKKFPFSRIDWIHVSTIRRYWFSLFFLSLMTDTSSHTPPSYCNMMVTKVVVLLSLCWLGVPQRTFLYCILVDISSLMSILPPPPRLLTVLQQPPWQIQPRCWLPVLYHIRRLLRLYRPIWPPPIVWKSPQICPPFVNRKSWRQSFRQKKTRWMTMITKDS